MHMLTHINDIKKYLKIQTRLAVPYNFHFFFRTFLPSSLAYFLHYWSLSPHVIWRKCKNNSRICKYLLFRVLKLTQEIRVLSFFFSPIHFLKKYTNSHFFSSRWCKLLVTAGDGGWYPPPLVLRAAGAAFIFGVKAATVTFRAAITEFIFLESPRWN